MASNVVKRVGKSPIVDKEVDLIFEKLFPPDLPARLAAKRAGRQGRAGKILRISRRS